VPSKPSQNQRVPHPDDIDHPLEVAIERIGKPFDVFLHNQGSSGIMLFGCAVIALWLANSEYAEQYHQFFQTLVGITVGHISLEKSIVGWINEALMPLFFFVLGLEIKREIVAGDLRNPRNSLLVIISAVGGMLVPAAIYLFFNLSPGTHAGWGIPMATDTAFALGALLILGKRLPEALLTLLVAIAIIDDLGAVLVIAIFYTDTVDWQRFALTVPVLITLLLCNKLGIRKAWPYACGGLLIWFVFLSSGVHTTMAGVLAALAVPASPRHGPNQFMQRMRKLLKHLERTRSPDQSIISDPKRHAVILQVHSAALLATTPLQRWERSLEVPVSLFVLPIFALGNAGISIPDQDIISAVSTPITMGIILALVIGKFLGITLACLLALWCGIGKLPTAVHLHHIAGMALIAGMGFTMSMFIGSLAFENAPNLLQQAKIGILCGSLLAGLSGISWLAVCCRFSSAGKQPLHKVRNRRKNREPHKRD